MFTTNRNKFILYLMLMAVCSTSIAEKSPRFEATFEKNDLKKWTGIEVANEQSIQFVTNPVRKGKYALKLSIAEGQGKTNSGVRSEVTYDNNDQEGSDTWYAWSFMMPESFKESPSYMFQLVGQWHDQPNTTRGETWDDFPSNIPSIGLYYGTTKVSEIPQKYHSQLMQFAHLLQKPTFTGIAVHAGTEDQKIVAMIPVEKGVWNDLMLHIKWSRNEDGYIEVFHNNIPVGPLKHVKTMWNDFPHYLKLGLYRDPRIEHANHIFYDEVRVGSTRQQVVIKP